MYFEIVLPHLPLIGGSSERKEWVQIFSFESNPKFEMIPFAPLKYIE